MRKKILVLSLLLITLIILTACWDYIEYENLAHVVGMSIDYDREKAEFTVAIQNVSTNKTGGNMSSDGSEKPSASETGNMHSADDKTIFGALTKVQQIVSEELFLGYLKIVILGENAAKYKMNDCIELFDRTPAIRKNAYIAVATGKGKDTLATIDMGSKLTSSQEIFNLIELSKSTGTSYPVTIQNYCVTAVYKGYAGITPHVITSVKKDQKLEAKGGVYKDFKIEEHREGGHLVSGMAVFEDNKLLGWLNEKESMGYNWILKHNIKPYMTTENNENKESKDMAYFKVYSSKCKMKIRLEEEKPIISLKVNAIAHIRKYYSHSGSEYITPKDIQKMEKKVSEGIRSDIVSALNKAQKELKSDIFGFGFNFSRKYSKQWDSKFKDEWDDIYPKVKVDIEVNTKIVNTGLNTRKLDFK